MYFLQKSPGLSPRNGATAVQVNCSAFLYWDVSVDAGQKPCLLKSFGAWGDASGMSCGEVLPPDKLLQRERCFQLEGMHSPQVNSASHALPLEMTSFVVNQPKLSCLHSVHFTLVWPQKSEFPTSTSATSPHFSFYHFSTFQQFTQSDWANRWRCCVPAQPTVYYN